MSKKTLILLAIIVVGVGWFLLSRNRENKIVSPVGLIPSSSKSTPTPTSAPPNAPKTFKFDSSTDLKQELDSINPQVLDSDFE